jgi:hypothetical protein
VEGVAATTALLRFASLLFPKIVGISVLDEAFAPFADSPVVGTGARRNRMRFNGAMTEGKKDAIISI